MASGVTIVSGLSVNKQVFNQALDDAKVTDPKRRAQLMATGLLEGNLSFRSNDASKGPGRPSANFSPANLNDGMVTNLGLAALEPALTNTANLKGSYAAAILVING